MTTLKNFLILAGLYYLTGKLGLLMAVPPGYATAVWPPSGFALAGLLVFGNRYWPSIWLGSFLVNIGTSLDPTSFSSILRTLTPALVIGFGAALQALAGFTLVRKALGHEVALLSGKEVSKFLFLAGPVSCLINSTVGVGTLVLTGAIQAQSAFFSWWTWWMGDSLGVLIFAPLMMIFSAQPREVWRARRLTVGLPMTVTFILMVALFVVMKKFEEVQIRSGFNAQSELVVSETENQFNRYLDNLYSLQSFYRSSNDVERSEFSSFVSSALARSKAVVAFEWDPKVLRAERAGFEQSVRDEGYPDFEIKDLNAKKEIQKASERDVYFPVTFAEPFAENEKVFGFDFMSEPSRESALEIAWKSGNLAFTKPIELIQGPVGVIAFLAIYKNRAPLETEQDRTDHLKGFVVEVLKVEDIIVESLANFKEKNFVFHVVDVDPVEGELTMFTRDFSRVGRSLQDLSSVKKVARGLRFEKILTLGGRQWRFEVYPTADYFIAQESWVMWFLFAGGLVFVGFLGGFLIIISGREMLVRRLVDQKTEDINKANSKLQQGIEQHEALSRSLEARNKELDEARMVALNIAEDAHEAQMNALEAEERFRMIVEGVKDYAIYLLDENGFIVTWNLGAERFKGYVASEIIGQHFSRFYTKEDIATGKPKRALEIAIKNGSYEENGIRVRKDGTTFHARVLITALKDKQGHLRGFSKITRDITAEKEREDEVQRLSTFQKAIMDSAGSSIISTTTEGIITSFNLAAEKMLGYRAEEMIGKCTPEVIHDKDEVVRRAAEFSDVLNQKIEPGFEVFVARSRRNLPNIYEWTYIRKDGSRLAVLLTVTAIRDYLGAIVGFIGIATDITERKRIESGLAKLSQAVEQSPVTVVITDTKGTIEYVNPAFEKTSGYSRAEALGQNPRVLKSGEQSQEFYRELWETIKAGHIWRGEFHNKRKSGELYWEAASISPIIGKTGVITHFVAVKEDITLRKEAELKLVEAMNIKSEFTSMVSHELRTPLTVIKESVSIVQDETAGPLNPDQKDFLDTAKRNVDRLARLINDVLDYQKLESRHMEFRMTEADINNVVSEVGKSFELPLKNKGLGIKYFLQPDLPALFFDRDRIIQVLTNLINNAMKFTQGGSIDLITEKTGDNAVKISVRDYGVGIKEEDLGKLFQSFSQISTGMGRQTGSTGLGLAVSKKIVESHNGKVGVESVFGQGSTFYFILPIRDRRS